MNKKQFKEFCKEEFTKRGFKKHKNAYYLYDKGLLCGLSLQKSDFGPCYYINFWYCIGEYENVNDYPTYYDSDIDDRITVSTNYQKDEYKEYMTVLIEYEYYNGDDLRPYFDKEFEERILPPIYQGKKFILDNLGKLYSLTLNQEEVMKKLQL